MPRRSGDSCLQENQESTRTCTLSMTCQIDVVNKQRIPPLRWKNPFSENMLMVYLETCRCQDKIYSHAKYNLAYTQFVDATVKGILM